MYTESSKLAQILCTAELFSFAKVVDTKANMALIVIIKLTLLFGLPYLMFLLDFQFDHARCFVSERLF